MLEFEKIKEAFPELFAKAFYTENDESGRNSITLEIPFTDRVISIFEIPGNTDIYYSVSGKEDTQFSDQADDTDELICKLRGDLNKLLKIYRQVLFSGEDEEREKLFSDENDDEDENEYSAYHGYNPWADKEINSLILERTSNGDSAT